MCAALTDLGYEDSRLDEAYAWMARSVTGEGVQRYYAYKCGPGLVCGANGKLPCSWGAVKVMLAFGKLPSAKHTPLVEAAIKAGAAFLFSCDPVEANYPTRGGHSPQPRLVEVRLSRLLHHRHLAACRGSGLVWLWPRPATTERHRAHPEQTRRRGQVASGV